MNEKMKNRANFSTQKKGIKFNKLNGKNKVLSNFYFIFKKKTNKIENGKSLFWLSIFSGKF
jgi:hypothetical protein